ncbi:MAG: hypothetical protein M1330_04235 [Armatimonadetes bacterium]|nr:hypothetical protein [Armatimonadota bacterium]
MNQPDQSDHRPAPGKNKLRRREFIRVATTGLSGLWLAGALSPDANADPNAPRDLWIVPHDALSPAEQAFALTLQGLANRVRPQIWMKAGSTYQIIEDQLKQEGVRFHHANSIWELLAQFRDVVKGAFLCRINAPSLNVATSLCGLHDAVALDESLMSRAQTAKLNIIADVREWDERKAFDRYRNRFARGILVEQTPQGAGPGFLRDYAVAHNAFTYYTTDDGFRTEAARALGPDALAYGWGPSEYPWVKSLSLANATGVGSDWSLNLSALQHLTAGPIIRPKRPVPPKEDGVRYVAFVMTDGDNVQWLCGSFVGNERYWSSPLRGQFPFTWEVSPMLTQVAPRVLKYLYFTAKDTEGFVTGAGVPGYTYIHFQPDPRSIALQAEPFLRRADLPFVGILNANEGHLNETIPLLELPYVEAVLYKDYAPYNRHQGKVFWHQGKPCISFRYMLWQGLMTPQQVAQGVSQMPLKPLSDENSYALVTVHAWSFGDIGGPLEAVRRTIALLPPNTHVVTADQLVTLMKSNLSRLHMS